MLHDILIGGGILAALVVLAIVFAPRRRRRSQLAPTRVHAQVIPFHNPKHRVPFESKRPKESA